MKLLGVVVLFMLKPFQLLFKGLKALGKMFLAIRPYIEILTYTVAGAALAFAGFGKVVARIIKGDFKGAKEAFKEVAKTVEDYKNGVGIGTEATETFGKGMKVLDKMTLGLGADLAKLVMEEDEYTGAVVENKNELDDANRKLKERSLLVFQLKNATSDLAAKQLLLSSTTLAGENENKAFIKTLGQFNAKVKENINVTEVKSMADLEAYIQKNFQNKEEAQDLINIFHQQHRLNQLNANGAMSDKKAREERQKGMFELAEGLKGLIGDNKTAALVGIRISQAQAIADAYAAFNKYNAAMRPGLAKFALVRGLINAAAIEKQQGKVSSAAFGADFIADSPQFVKVGDNPQMRERVTVTPIGSPNVRGGGGASEVVINLNGNILGTQEFVRDTLIPQLEDSLGRNLA